MKFLKSKTKYKRIILVISLIFFALFFLKSIKNSLFFKKNERINLVFYDKKIVFYSIDFENNLNYFLSFPVDLKVMIPGGFGYYRLGGLGKLVFLEKKPEIYQKTFSALTNSFLNYYFYSDRDGVYFNNETLDNYKAPDFKKIFLYQSNVNIFDRFYLFLLFLQKKPTDFKKIEFLPTIKKNTDVFIDQKKIADYLKGFFYKNKLRKERANVQLIYSNSYENAVLITSIIEGEGIWITDISQEVNTDNNKQKCKILVSPDSDWLTARYLNDFFNCTLIKKKVDAFDIIIVLGSLENDWAVK